MQSRRIQPVEGGEPEDARSVDRTVRPSPPRRALAIVALIISIVGLGGVLRAPSAAQHLQQPGTPLGDAAGSIAPPGAPPALCSACRPGGAPWVSPGHSPLIDRTGEAAHVDPGQVAAADSEAPPDRRFGAVEAFEAPFAASYAGVGWERINFDWPALQPGGPHSWNRAAISGVTIAHEIAAGREVVGIIGGRPAWAVDARGLPRGLYLPPTDPRNMWGAFVAELARRYRGRVRHWIIWNEPDVWDAHASGYTWPGTVDDFARLQKVAYTQIKSVDPFLVVHLAATTYWWDKAYNRPLYFGRLLDALARDPTARAHHWYFDVASAHVYNVPDDVERIIRIDRDLMHAHGFGKPLWLVETNAMPTRDGPWTMASARWSATAAEQAAYVVQASALALAAGAERVSFYKMTDPAGLSTRAYPMGLVRPDGTARPVVAALRATTHALADWTRAVDLGTTAGVRAVAIERGASGASGGTLVLWATGTSSADVTVDIPVPPGATAAWLDAHVAIVADDDTGLPVVATIAGDRAILRLTLPASACAQTGLCQIGGAPLMVVAPAMPRIAAW